MAFLSWVSLALHFVPLGSKFLHLVNTCLLDKYLTVARYLCLALSSFLLLQLVLHTLPSYSQVNCLSPASASPISVSFQSRGIRSFNYCPTTTFDRRLRRACVTRLVCDNPTRRSRNPRNFSQGALRVWGRVPPPPYVEDQDPRFLAC